MRLIRSRRLRFRVVGVMAGAVAATLVASLVYMSGNAIPAATGEGPENPAIPNEWMWAQRANPDGTIPAGAIREAMARTREIEVETRAFDEGLLDVQWRLLGPANVGARLIDIVIDPNTPNIVYTAAGTGGVWKSVDGGVTFASVWPDSLPQSMGALAVLPDGTLFAGTGEPDHGGGGSYYGTGVYRSVDGGKNWTSVGLTNTGSTGRIRIDPANPKRIFVASQGRLFDNGGDRGLFLSEDGGNSWRKVLAGMNSTSGAIDVAISPTNPNIILAAMWDKLRFPDGREYGGPGSGVYRSVDGGQTWARVGAPLPGPEAESGRMGVAFATSDPGRAYAITNDRIGNLTGFFVSNDAGATWTRPMTGEPALDGADGGFAWWFARLFVDPANADHLFSIGVPMMESFNGGLNWVSSPGSRFHVDQHAMAWDPHHANRVYIGNDGGLYWSDQNGLVTGAWTKSTYQPYMQFYAMDVSAQDVTRVSGGTQDNNSLRSWGGADWNAYRGGDGMMNRINPVDLNNVFACSQNGGCARSDNGGNTMTSIRARFAGTRFNWVSPLEIAAGSPDTVYFGSNILNRSDDRGVTWRAVSPDLTGGPTPRNSTSYGTITTIGIARTDKETVYVGTDDGRLWVTRDGGTTWTRLTDPDLPDRWVTRVTVDPDDANTAWVTYSGFRNESETQPHVLMTTDGGANWTDISGRLPQSPVNDVIRDPRHRQWLYVGTDMGVFFSPNLGRVWLKVGLSFPKVPVTDIHFHAGSRTLFAATFGRGILSIRTLG